MSVIDRNRPIQKVLDHSMWRRHRSVTPLGIVEIVQKIDAYELTAELPGVDEKNVEGKTRGEGGAKGGWPLMPRIFAAGRQLRRH
jgi:hypothetical protein